MKKFGEGSYREVFKPDSEYRPFFISLLAFGLGYGIYKGVIDNYLAEIVVMTEFDRGVAEFFRELPGLLLVFILAACYMLSAERLYQAGAVIMLAGMGMLGIVPASKALVTIAICIYSLGEHIQLGMKNTLTLEYAKPGQSGAAMGYQNSANQVGHLVGYVVIIICFLFLGSRRPYRLFFMIAAAFTALGMIESYRLRGHSETDKTKSR